MITIFTTGKPFRGHDGIIQHNALKSWKLLDPNVQVILFGDEEGAAETCAQLGLRHEPHVERHESGVKRLDYMFARARKISPHSHLCFSNCDIVLMQDFWKAVQIARSWKNEFLLVGQRWDTDVTEPLEFDSPDWAERLRQFALTSGFQQTQYWIDFFLFSRGLYAHMPPLLVGHCYWDNWMVWDALSEGAAVLDATRSVLAVHQNHGYSPAFGRVKGLATDALSQRNLQLIGGVKHARTIRAATHRIRKDGRVARNLRRHVPHMPIWLLPARRFLTYDVWLPCWHFALDITRPARTVLKLRSKHNERLGSNPMK
ncbi:MAG: hypothetical protein WBE13_14420 [Candidatus Acidiferrum sp.]